MAAIRCRIRPSWFRPSSGNHAFDEYRTETLRRLEDEQREFKEFLERLRFARDKTEFDQFMAERRNRTSPTIELAAVAATAILIERSSQINSRRRCPQGIGGVRMWRHRVSMLGNDGDPRIATPMSIKVLQPMTIRSGAIEP